MTDSAAADDRWRRPRVGISECLLGCEVRHDGEHKRHRVVTDILAEHFHWVPVCPEVEVGMGIPREPVRLVRRPGGPHMITVESDEDWTERMRTYSAKRVEALATEELCGYILKKDSPSCGMERVKLHDDDGLFSRTGRGLFAEELMSRLPDLPVVEEDRFDDRDLREDFIRRVYAYDRRRRLLDGAAKSGGKAR